MNMEHAYTSHRQLIDRKISINTCSLIKFLLKYLVLHFFFAQQRISTTVIVSRMVFSQFQSNL